MTATGGIARVGDVDLAYECRGSGPPFVLVHGWTGSGRGWHPAADPLTRRVTVVTYDQRGHGRSTNVGDPEAYTFDLLVDDLAGLVDVLALEPFHLLGHSMGGAVAMRYALRAPERVRSLVLLDTGAKSAAGSIDLMQPLIDIVEAGGLPAYITAALPYVGPPGPAGEDRRALFTWDIEHLDPVAFVTLARALCSSPSVLDELAGLRTPTTVIVGEDDTHLRAASDEMASTIPGAVLEVIAGAAHIPHHEQPEAWLAAIEAHLDRAERGARQ